MVGGCVMGMIGIVGVQRLAKAQLSTVRWNDGLGDGLRWSTEQILPWSDEMPLRF
jgi:hypothetical protein